MYTLFYSPGSCSMAVHVVLNEIGADFTLEDTSLAEGKNRTPEFLKINPRGQVPVLKDGEKVLREGAAILLYLLEKHNSPLFPQSGDARPSACEWLMFCNATLHPAYGRIFFLMKRADDQEAKEKLIKVSVEQINTLWKEVETRLEESQFLAGETLTVADILLTVIANWSARIPGIEIGPKAKKLFKTVIARPSYKKALETEKVEYKVAA